MPPRFNSSATRPISESPKTSRFANEPRFDRKWRMCDAELPPVTPTPDPRITIAFGTPDALLVQLNQFGFYYLAETLARAAAFFGRLRIFALGNSNARILSFALCNCDFELPIEQSSNCAISWCW